MGREIKGWAPSMIIGPRGLLRDIESMLDMRNDEEED